MFKHDFLKRSERAGGIFSENHRGEEGLKCCTLMAQCCVAAKKFETITVFPLRDCYNNPSNSSHVHMQSLSLIYDPCCFLNV